MAVATVLTYVVLDCADCRELAGFYSTLLGWRVSENPDDPRWANVVPPGREGEFFRIACQQIEDHTPPTWPSGPVPQQGHLDFYVADLDAAVREAEAMGARRHEVQPAEDGSFVVFVDPAGHPFCLCVEGS